MLSGSIRTTGLKLAKSAFIQPEGTGYIARNITKHMNVIDHSVRLGIPKMASKLCTNFNDTIPAMYRNRISKDKDLSRLL